MPPNVGVVADPLVGAMVPLGAAEVPLPVEGANAIAASATDLAGNTGSAGISVISDTTPPVITVTGLGDGALPGTSPVTMTGTVVDATPPDVGTVNGATVALSGDSFTTQVVLNEGANSLSASAIEKAGNGTFSSITVTLDTPPPEIAITTPVSYEGLCRRVRGRHRSARRSPRGASPIAAVTSVGAQDTGDFNRDIAARFLTQPRVDLAKAGLRHGPRPRLDKGCG